MTDTNTDPFQTNEQVNPMDYVKTKFAKGDEIDLEALARGKYEADKHIQVLEAEALRYRQEAEKGLAIKDLLEAIKADKSGIEEPPLNEQENKDTARKDEPNIDEVVQNALTKAENERKEVANKQAVVNKLNEVWGQNVGSELRKVSQSLGVSVSELEAMGKKSPQALFKLLGVDTPARAPGATRVPTSTANIGGTSTGKRDAAYYRELYKSNPALRYDSKINVQEMNDAMEQGEAFFN